MRAEEGYGMLDDTLSWNLDLGGEMVCKALIFYATRDSTKSWAKANSTSHHLKELVVPS